MRFKNDDVKTIVELCPPYTGKDVPEEHGYMNMYQNLAFRFYTPGAKAWETTGGLPCYAQLKYGGVRKGRWLNFSPPLSCIQGMDDWLLIMKKVFLEGPNPVHKNLIKDIFNALFGEEHPTADEFCQQVLRKYGWIIPGEVLDKWPIQAIYNFGIAQRAGWDHDGVVRGFKAYIDLGATGPEALVYSRLFPPENGAAGYEGGHWWFASYEASIKQLIKGDYDLNNVQKTPFNVSRNFEKGMDEAGWNYTGERIGDKFNNMIRGNNKARIGSGPAAPKKSWAENAQLLINLGRELAA